MEKLMTKIDKFGFLFILDMMHNNLIRRIRVMSLVHQKVLFRFISFRFLLFQCLEKRFMIMDCVTTR